MIIQLAGSCIVYRLSADLCRQAGGQLLLHVWPTGLVKEGLYDAVL